VSGPQCRTRYARRCCTAGLWGIEGPFRGENSPFRVPLTIFFEGLFQSHTRCCRVHRNRLPCPRSRPTPDGRDAYLAIGSKGLISQFPLCLRHRHAGLRRNVTRPPPPPCGGVACPEASCFHSLSRAVETKCGDLKDLTAKMSFQRAYTAGLTGRSGMRRLPHFSIVGKCVDLSGRFEGGILPASQFRNRGTRDKKLETWDPGQPPCRHVHHKLWVCRAQKKRAASHGDNR
jgi:hypothetical protein